MRIDLQIGEYHIRLDERADVDCLQWPRDAFAPFAVLHDGRPDLHLDVKVVTDLPEVPHGELVFDACQGLWKLYATASGFLLDAPDTQSLAPRARAILSEDFSHGEVWFCAQRNGQEKRLAWTPMHVINPIVEACLVTRLAREGGLLLHSAGILTEHGGWVFTGASGAGKSTLSDLFAARGRRVLSDERIIIRTVADELLAYGTPWPGDGRQATNTAVPLTALYCIRHGNGAHALRKISPRDFSLFVLRQCFLPHWDRAAMDRTLAFVGELAERIECQDLAFLKNPDIVDYLEERHYERPLVPT